MNVQIHCEHCDVALYRYKAEVNGSTVVLYDENRDRQFDGLGNESRMEFCDWVCVQRWALIKASA